MFERVYFRELRIYSSVDISPSTLQVQYHPIIYIHSHSGTPIPYFMKPASVGRSSDKHHPVNPSLHCTHQQQLPSLHPHPLRLHLPYAITIHCCQPSAISQHRAEHTGLNIGWPSEHTGLNIGWPGLNTQG